MEKQSFKNIIKRLFLFSCLAVSTVALFGLLSQHALAANMSFSPSSGSYTVGKTFSIGVYVSSSDQAMNAASGAISFPADKLEVVSVSKSGSIFNLWVQEPSFSNSAGTVNFEGIVLNPGYTGSSKKVLGVTFKTKAVGDAALTFSSASVLANDGKGTNILAGLGKASFNISSAKVTAPLKKPSETPSKSPSVSIGVPSTPIISSTTHSDSDKWYANNDPRFKWSLLKNIIGVNRQIDKNPNTSLPARSYGRIGSYTTKNLADGTWYFHVRLKNNFGWGATAHFKFKIDTKKPFHLNVIKVSPHSKTSGFNVNDAHVAEFLFTAEDETSGIDHYEIAMDDNDPEIWHDSGSHVYQTSTLSQGKHILFARAIDGAGNFTEKSVKFSTDETLFPMILSGMIVIIALILLLIILLWFDWHRLSAMKEKIRQLSERLRHRKNRK